MIRSRPSILRQQQGIALIEILISLLITAFGVLGYIGFQARTSVAQLEGYQRTQALMLLNDMAERISLNRENAAAYVANDIGVADPGNCALAANRAAADICEWASLIRGVAEEEDGASVGAMINARACITRPIVGADEFVISLVWQGVQASGAPTTACGQGAYASEDTRRAVTTRVQIADLGA
jgi:type IV pilus assembly protein PilV